jgi:palmitoyltransferase
MWTYHLSLFSLVDYLVTQKRKLGMAAAFLTLFFLFLFLTPATYLRTFLAVKLDLGLVFLHPEAEVELPTNIETHSKRETQSGGIQDPSWPRPNSDNDCPGHEKFYGKYVFICEEDGRPRWCSICRRWKPDRLHLSSDLGRCVRKMDHVCPWAGGVLSETYESISPHASRDCSQKGTNVYCGFFS